MWSVDLSVAQQAGKGGDVREGGWNHQGKHDARGFHLALRFFARLQGCEIGENLV